MVNICRPGLGVHVRYKVDEKRIAHQEVDGEVIAIDFVNGAYFSMQKSAADIWRMLLAGASLADVGARYRGEGAAAEADMEAEITAFAAELVAANLLVADDRADAAPALPATPAHPYAPPHLEKFDDMADLIMLDPVHDVSEAGWPHAAAQPA
jgi:hypothetical protein